MKKLLLANAKALTALLAAILLRLALKYGLRLDETTIDGVSTLLVACAVYLIPNRPLLPSERPTEPEMPAALDPTRVRDWHVNAPDDSHPDPFGPGGPR